MPMACRRSSGAELLRQAVDAGRPDGKDAFLRERSLVRRRDVQIVLRQLRQGGSRLPVLMLTARSELNDRVRGLDAGADYYLTKPFEPEELLACIRSLLRRGGEDAAADPEVTAFGDLTLHMGTFLLECGPRSVRLSRREYDLMELLMRNGSQIVSKEQLILKVWGYDSAAEDNNVEVYISFLRRKLTHLQSTVKIKTLRMVGYCLEVEA